LTDMNIFSQKHMLIKTAAFLILAIITSVFFNYIGLYIKSGPELIENAGFSDGIDGWHYIGQEGSMAIESSNTVRLHSDDGASSPRIIQIIRNPERFKLLMLSGEIRTEDVRGGISGWHKARLILGSYDADDRWIPVEHNVAALEGDNSWKLYSRVFRIPVEAEIVRVTAQLARSSGSMWVRGISLKEAVKKPIYRYWSLLYPVWFIFLLWLLLPAIAGCKGILLKGVALLIIAAIIYGTLSTEMGSLQPAGGEKPAVESASGQERQERPSVKDHLISKINLLKKELDINKVGHFILFALLLIILASGSGHRGIERVLLSLVIFAAATEMMQFFVENRTPLVRDWLTDISGLAAGFVIFYIAYKSLGRGRVTGSSG
jgi:hypothetical protein